MLEDMLHMYVMDKPSKWEDYLHLVEFAYNNGQQASLGMTMRQHDSIVVVVDKLTKASHFIPVKSTYKVDAIAKIFMKEIFRLHGLPKAIISDRDTKFTSNFWKSMFVDLGTKLNFSTAYHPQTDG